MSSGTARCLVLKQAALLQFNSVFQFSLPPAEFFCSVKGLLYAIRSLLLPCSVESRLSLSKTRSGAFDADGRDGALRRPRILSNVKSHSRTPQRGVPTSSASTIQREYPGLHRSQLLYLESRP